MAAHCYILGALVGPQVETKPWQIQLPSRKLELELTTVSSNYHVEMNPSDVGNNDRYVVQEIIKVRLPLQPMGQHSTVSVSSISGRH